MKFFAGFFHYGLKKTPIIVVEQQLTNDTEFEGCLKNLYIDILQDCKYIILPNNVICIYKAASEGRRRIEFVFKVKEEFIRELKDELFFELHMYTNNGFMETVEKIFINTVLYKDKFPYEVVANPRPVFNIKQNRSGSAVSLLKIYADKK